MVSLEDIALFENFEAGKLNEKQLEDFKQKLDSDAAFKSNYQKYLSVIKSVKHQHKYKERIQLFNDFFKSKERSVSRHISTNESSTGSFPVKAVIFSSLIAIVLTLAAVFFIMPLIQKDGTDEVVETSAEVEVVEKEIAPVPVAADTTETTVVPATPEPPVQLTINAFMISQSGYFLTQYSKIKDSKSLRILGADTMSRKVDLIHFDTGLDLAVLKAEKADIKHLGTLVFRLATTQASPDTDIMLSYYFEAVKSINGKITVNETTAPGATYSTDISFNEHCIGAPIISKNGNVIGMALQKGEQFEIVKSTELVAWLNRAAAEGKLPDYMPTTENRLSGLERPDQLNRLTPFLNKVLLFY